MKKNPLQKMRSKTEVIKDIEKTLEEYIQPTVQMHGGMVSLQDFDDGVATIFMSGACSGCAMSTQTLHMGIENMLKYYIKEVLAVKGVEDPNSTMDPYYQ
jgi:Fe-S cluster biogenesis protein NfuA